MKVEITNTGLRFFPANDREEEDLEDFADETAYTVEGAHFLQEYKSGHWDGREVLIKFTHGKWRGAVGLLSDAFERFGECEVVDNRREVGASLSMMLDPEIIQSLRPYQKEAVEAVLEDRGVMTGKGLLRLPTRSGKTVIAAGVIARTGLRTVFIVNSEMLLRQTVEFFTKVLLSDSPPGGLPLVGQYGGGENVIGWVTVASVQSVTAHLKKPVMKALLSEADVVFFDECHHLEAPLWRKAMTFADAVYKVGLSATIYLDRLRNATRGTIWLVGATGPILYELEPSDLIEDGWLCRPVITFVSSPPLPWEIDGSSFPSVYRAGIVEHEARNELVAKIAREEVDLGRRVLITVRQLKHVKLIEAALRGVGLSYSTVTGKTPGGKRRELTDTVKRREADVLLGTVFGEAVDLPWLECVIIADAGASRVLAMQRLRNLTPVDEWDRSLLSPMETATEVPVYDFADFDHKTLKRHTRERLRTYRSHRAFRIIWRRE